MPCFLLTKFMAIGTNLLLFTAQYLNGRQEHLEFCFCLYVIIYFIPPAAKEVVYSSKALNGFLEQISILHLQY